MSAVAEARRRLEGAQTIPAPFDTRAAKIVYADDLSLILALPDREALAAVFDPAAFADETPSVFSQSGSELLDRRLTARLHADRILSHLKGESSND